MSGKIIAVCTSEKKGTQKTPCPEITLREDWGIVGDAHAGKWHRQVSILSYEQIEAFRKRGAEVDFGAFGENIVASGYDFKTLPPGTRFRIGDVELELTQVGKECHSHCEIFKVMKDCIMPREGVFTRVLHGGVIRPGMELSVISEQAGNHTVYQAAVITVSDKGYRGEREDKSGPAVAELLRAEGYDVVYTEIVPDERERISEILRVCADERHCALIVTTGGTGFSPRDVTPEATMDVIERLTPGLPELMRAESMRITPNGCLSRSTSGIRGRSLILNLPGSEKAARENLAAVLRPLRHGLRMLFSEGSSEHGV